MYVFFTNIHTTLMMVVTVRNSILPTIMPYYVQCYCIIIFVPVIVTFHNYDYCNEMCIRDRCSTMLIYWVDSMCWVEEKTAPFYAKKKSSSTMTHTSSLVHKCHSKTDCIMLPVVASSTVFSRFGLLQFLFVSTHGKLSLIHI